MDTILKLPMMSLTTEQERLIQAFNCAVGGRFATYLSGPITTGRRFIDWYIDVGYSLENDINEYQNVKYESVLSKNELDIIKVANTLRKDTATLVIEPASLHIAPWNQKDYHQFWTEVLKRFVNRVVILDGWQYSIGCAIEFHYAIQRGICVEAQNGVPLNEQDGKNLILEAADDIEHRGARHKALIQIAQTLRANAD